MRTDILGVGVDNVTMGQALSRARDMMPEKRGAYVCTPNPEMVWACRKNEALRNAVNGAALSLPDGIGILWAAKKLGPPLRERVTGLDFFLELLAETEGTVFLLGGRPGVAEEAARNIQAQFPGVTVVGCQDGYFTDDEPVLRKIREAQPDFLAVCLGMGKQELWMAEHHETLPVGLMAGLGGSLDVLAGRVKRAPEFWRGHKLEWLYRLLREPKRIKRQICLPLYVTAVLARRKSL